MDEYSKSSHHYIEAREDFRRARQKAAIQELWANVTGQSISLLHYDQVARSLRIAGGTDRGLQDIPISAIKGTLSRTDDFTRDFLPRTNLNETRWARVKSVMEDMSYSGLDPIRVYQVGDVYFVADGHHRVSVARQMGAEKIQAYVIEIKTRVPLESEDEPEDLILKAEYVDFLEQTQLDQLRSDVSIKFTMPGLYSQLLHHIEVHRYYMGTNQQREISFQDAVIDWYDNVYLPIIKIIRSRQMLREFPGRTESDLYLWVSEHNYFMEKETGWKISPEKAATEFLEKFRPKATNLLTKLRIKVIDLLVPDQLEGGLPPGAWRKQKDTVETNNLFNDILVPISGSESSWSALDQALELAKQDKSYIQGLTILRKLERNDSDRIQTIQSAFQTKLIHAGIDGSLAVSRGEISQTIINRAFLSDIVSINVSHPPSTEPIKRLNSGLTRIIRQCPRPILAVPGQFRALCNLLLAYDGSPKSEEALFLATYLAAKCSIPVVSVSILNPGEKISKAAERANGYFKEHRVNAEILTPTGDVIEQILKIANDYMCNLIIMGGYGSKPFVEMFIGSTVDGILRSSQIPVLICR